MTVAPPLELRIGDRLRLRKEHPCGSRDWAVVRLGADIGLVCDGCSHRILMDRLDVFGQRARDVAIGRGDHGDPTRSHLSRGEDRPRDQRPSADRMQHLRDRRTHPGSLAGGHDQDGRRAHETDRIGGDAVESVVIAIGARCFALVGADPFADGVVRDAVFSPNRAVVRAFDLA